MDGLAGKFLEYIHVNFITMNLYIYILATLTSQITCK